MMVGSIEVFVATASFALLVVWAWGMFSFRVPDLITVHIMQTLHIPGWVLYIPGIVATIGIILAFCWIK